MNLRATATTMTATALFAAAVISLSSPTSAGAASAGGSKFCRKIADASRGLPDSLSTMQPSTALVFSKLVKAAEGSAPARIRRSVATLTRTLGSFADAHESSTGTSGPATRDQSYAQALTVVRTYSSKYCPAAVPTSPNLPGIDAANQTACLQDQAVLKQAEDLYDTVNGNFASMSDLVSGQFIREVSSYYAEVRIDDPPGGYTLIPVPSGPCANVPVAG